MGFNDILKSLFGNKSDRDLKELLPIASKVNVEWEKIKGVSHDELRQISADLKAKIHAHVKEEEDEIVSLKAKVENEKPSIEEREEIYNRIDKLEEQINTKLEDVLNEILPLAFAVMKDTARRFKENMRSSTEFLPAG